MEQRMDGRTNKWIEMTPYVLEDIVPFGAAARKGFFTISRLAYVDLRLEKKPRRSLFSTMSRDHSDNGVIS